VREESFRDLDDALSHARLIVGQYLGQQPQADNQTTA
jgi:hypothetical protein